jgi:hypothetical protein
VSYDDNDTYQIDAWLSSDGDYIDTVQRLAQADPSGQELSTWVRNLLFDKMDNGKVVTSRQRRQELDDLLGQVALDRVDWREIARRLRG